MNSKRTYSPFETHLKLKLIAFCLLFSLSTLPLKAQDSAVNYKHNFGIFPVYEGMVFKYEHKLNTKRNKSFRYTLTLKGHDDNSLLFPFKKYNEQKATFQFRNYTSKYTPFVGLYHGTCLQYKHFEGKGYEFSRGSTIINYNIQSLGLGYTIGWQYSTKSGFNYEIGWAIYYQLIKGNDAFYIPYIYSEIPYNPYDYLQSQLTFGIGMAIK